MSTCAHVARSWLALSALALALPACPSEVPVPVDDDDATTPVLGEPGCVVRVTNGTNETMASLSTAQTVTQFEPVELLDEPLGAGAERDLPLVPQQHHLVAVSEGGGWYEVGWVLCVWDEALAVTIEPADLRPAGIKLENATSQDIVSVVLSPVGALAWGPNLVDGDPLRQFTSREFPLDPGRWFAFARNAEGLGYFVNFELLLTPPQADLGISRMFTVPGDLCTWRIENGYAEDLVGVHFLEETTGLFLATMMPAGLWMPTGDAVDGAFPPGTWEIEVRFFDGTSRVESGVVCTDGEHYESVASP